MKSLIAAVALLMSGWSPAFAQSAPKITIALDVSSEGRAGRDATGTRLFDDVRRGLEAIGDVQLMPPDQSARIIWITAGASAGPYAASMLITERYDRETLMIIGIEDDEMANRMMALRIVNDHQIFTGGDLADVARRIVASVDTGILARVRALRPKQ